MSCGVSVEAITVFNKLGLAVSYSTLKNWFQEVCTERKKEIFIEVRAVDIYCVQKEEKEKPKTKMEKRKSDKPVLLLVDVP